MELENVIHTENSFPRIFVRKAELTEQFYHHLRLNFPETKALLPDSFWEQKELFERMLAGTFRGLSGSGNVQKLGVSLREKHSRYNLTQEHLGAFSAALTMALQDVMADDLSDQERAAWSETIATLARAMAPDQS